MALSLVCVMSLHADKELYGVKETDFVLKLYYDDQREDREGSKDWITDYADQTELVILDESILDFNQGWGIEFPDFINLEYIEHLDYYHHTQANTEGMFRNCPNLAWVDLSGFDFFYLLQGGNAINMFDGCYSLETIYCDEDLSGGKIGHDEDMFKDCNHLVGGNGTEFDPAYALSDRARPDEGPESEHPGYFTPTNERPIPGFVTSCDLKGFDRSAFQPGVVWTEELERSITNAIQPTQSDALYYVAYSTLYTFTDEDGYDVVEYGTELEEREYALDININIDDTFLHGQRFPMWNEADVTITVDGKQWITDGSYPYGTYSVCIGEIFFTLSEQGMENVQSNKVQGTKLLRNGQLLIERSGKTFNATGAQL